MDYLSLAHYAWDRLADFRQRRRRYKLYTYGKQWSDIILDNNGHPCTEEEYIRRDGRYPMVNNLIRQMVKTVVGRFRNLTDDSSIYSGAMAGIANANTLRELDSRMLEEFLISGTAVQRVSHAGDGIDIDNVDIRRFFVNKFSDPRGRDINLAGMLHDMSFPEVARRFSGGSRTKAQELQMRFAASSAEASITLDNDGDHLDFYQPANNACCRVIELWTLDSHLDDVNCDNNDALNFNTSWHCRWLAPDGEVLDHYTSPYAHGSHPFAVKFYPLTDGEIHSFVEDVIDQQRSINRMVVLIDKILATSAKGVLLFPADQKPDNWDWDEICQRWAQCDGVIPIKSADRSLPTQVMMPATNNGAYQLLQLQMKLFDDISGVGDALLGRSTARGAEMLEGQVRNATIALADIFETFTSFIRARNTIALQT